jgi:lipoprotein-releasing system permease protein
LNFEYFIAKRIIGSKSYKSSVSAPIIKIGIAAIAIGIIVMLIAIATGIGLEKKIREKTVAFNGHITISNFDSNESNESISPISSHQKFYPEFKRIDGIKHIQAVATKFGVIRTVNDFEGIIVKGVGADYNWSYIQDFLIAGKLPQYSETTSNNVLLSKYTANRLGLKVDDSFQIYFAEKDLNKVPRIRKFTIVGVFNSGFQQLDETYMIADLKHIQRLNKWEKDQIGSFEIFLDDFNTLDEKARQIYEEIPSTLNTQTVVEKYYSVFEWINIFAKNIYGIIGIMILVAGINMITALLVLILERMQMVGILKALGSDNWTIRKIFLYNASYLIILGLFWGNIIGISLLLLQKHFGLFPLNPDVYHVTSVPVYINITYIIALNIGTFVLCLIMLLIPSYIITKISPIKTIKFQ